MQQPTINRIDADPNEGLNAEQVRERVEAHCVNKVKRVVGKSYLSIFTTNVCTFFNLLGLIIAVLMAICGSFENMFFLVVIFSNTAIGIFQEIRSKLAVEKLSIMQQPTANVIRNGQKTEISADEIVLDDIVEYSAGKQISADGVVVFGEVEVNEALLTGESVSVKKKAGDALLSGSFVVSGNCRARTEKVGADNYVEQLSAKVRRFRRPNSELVNSIKAIIRVISFIVFPLGLGTFLTSGVLQGTVSWQVALKGAAGSMIGMVPSGMVLLTSVTLAVSVLKLARKKVLAKELYCVEMLSRVDTLCLDKTGTITDGSMTVEQVVPLNNFDGDVKALIAGVLAATNDDNLTAKALREFVKDCTPVGSTAALPFSSARKYSAATLDGVGTVAFGATEFMFGKDENVQKQCQRYLQQGMRVLAVGISDNPIDEDAVAGLKPIALVVLQDTVRSDASEIIRWFKDNDVAVKVISGDNPVAVSVIAQKVGVENAEKYISLEGMSDEDVAQAATAYTVFGRVSPEQKAVLVRALKKAGKTVAMTGDGVNDILAMRESDCAVSVGCGSDAAKSVAQLVLTDNKFGSMPKVVAEGRQVVNNIQNSSSLFLMKTSMTILTTVMLLLINVVCMAQGKNTFVYPFQPQHMYAMEFFVIGICSFLLALKPNHSLIKGKFISNTLRSTLPSGVAMFMSVAATYIFMNYLGIADSPAQISTVAMFSMTATGVAALLILLFPYDWYNAAVGALSVVGTIGCFFLFPWAISVLNNITHSQKAADPMYVPIDGKAVWFVVVNTLCMVALIIAIKLLLRLSEKKQVSVGK